MTFYFINPLFDVNANNIINIMTQLINDISTSITPIYNIVLEEQYVLMISDINQVLNNYLKIYNFNSFGIKNIYVQIYNQIINLVAFVNINIYPFKYKNDISNWDKFFFGKYDVITKVVYNELTSLQKNDLRYSIISDKLYFIDDILFTYNNLLTRGILIKPRTNCSDDCECIAQNNYCYVTTLYWN